MEWELTDEEKLKIFRGWRLEQGMNVLVDNYTQAQVKKLVEYYEGQCTEHWQHTSWYVPRRRCDSCMMELYRQVGLE